MLKLKRLALCAFPAVLLGFWTAAEVGLAQQATESVVSASEFHELPEIDAACRSSRKALCRVVISGKQSFVLSAPARLPVTMTLQFAPGGQWVISGAELTIGGEVEGPLAEQIFWGDAKVRGLRAARPEWFGVARNGVVPAQAVAAAYQATVPWGTILMNDSVYVSPFYDATKPDPCGDVAIPYRSPRRFLGVRRPTVDDETAPRRLQGGTILRGSLCGTVELQAAHMGVDVGPAVVQELYGGVEPDGIWLPNHGRFNPKRGTSLVDVSVLTNGKDGQHSVLIEGDEGAQIDGLWIWTLGGTHGLVLKSAHSNIRDFHCKGASADCLVIKSDYRTAGNGYAGGDVLEGIDIGYLRKPGDTGGIVLDGRWDNVDEIVLKNVHEKGLSYGVEGDGSWFYKVSGLQIHHWDARGMRGPCGTFRLTQRVAISDFVCEESKLDEEAAFRIDGTTTTALRDGVIECSADGNCKANGVMDMGHGTVVSRVAGRSLGGSLIVWTDSAKQSQYTELKVDGMGDREFSKAPQVHTTWRAKVRNFYATLKPHLRIIWESCKLRVWRASRWIRGLLPAKP